MKLFPLLSDQHRSYGVARFPETVDPSIYLPNCEDCGICPDRRDYGEHDGSNHMTDRGTVAGRRSACQTWSAIRA